MTVTSGNSLAGIGPPPVRSSSVPGGRSPGAAEDGEGRHDALAKGEAAETGGAGACRVSRGRAARGRAGATAYGAGDEGVTAADRMEHVVLPGARRMGRVIVYT